MRQNNRLSKCLGLLGMLTYLLGFTQAAKALTLGEIKSFSYLDQALIAYIDLGDTSDVTEDQIFVSIASQQDYQNAGVERNHKFLDLKFTVSLKQDNTGIISITSDRVMTEPYVNFLLNVQTPNGKFLREYILLLDPANYSNFSNEQLAVTAPTPEIAEETNDSNPSTNTGTSSDTVTDKDASSNESNQAALATPTLINEASDSVTATPSTLTQSTTTENNAAEQVTTSNDVAGTTTKTADNATEKVETITEETTIKTDPEPSAEVPVAQKQSILLSEQPTESKTLQHQLQQEAEVSETELSTYKVQNNDTLSKIALKLGANKKNIHQYMLKLFELNPKAFINGNINLVKVGATLVVPPENEIAQIDKKAAKQQIKEQTQTWRLKRQKRAITVKEGLTKPTLRSQPAQAVSTKQNNSGSLNIVATGKGLRSGGRAEKENNLFVLEEELDKTKLIMNDLNLNLQQSKETVELYNQIILLKNEQINSLTTRLQSFEHHTDASNAAAVNTKLPEPTNADTLVEPLYANQNQSAQPVVSMDAMEESGQLPEDHSEQLLEIDLEYDYKSIKFIMTTLLYGLYALIILFACYFIFKRRNRKETPASKAEAQELASIQEKIAQAQSLTQGKASFRTPTGSTDVQEIDFDNDEIIQLFKTGSDK